MTINNELSQLSDAKKQKTIFSLEEKIFAVFALLFGYLFIRSTMYSKLGLGSFLCVAAFVASVLIFKAVSERKLNFSLRIVGYAAVLLITGAVLAFSDNSNMKSLIFLFDMLLGLYWLNFTLGNSFASPLDYMLYYDSIRAIIILPFSCFGKCAEAIISLFDNREKWKKVLFFLIGVLLAVILCVIIVNILIYDTVFNNIIQKILSFGKFTFNPYTLFFDCLLSFLVGAFFFGAFFGAVHNQKSDTLSREKCLKNSAAVRILPAVTIILAITPVLLIYLLFFFSQTAYFTSAFSNILPENYTYAEYARSGFFELCKVSVINIIIIAVMENMSKRSERRPAILKIYGLLLSAVTLLLIFIAQSKIILYVSKYGLTKLRLYTLWFTLLLLGIFIFIILKLCIPKINLTRCAFTLFLILFFLLAVSDTDGFIAKYNISAYQSGKIETLDIDMLIYDLSDSAIPHILEYYSSLPTENHEKTVIREYYQTRMKIISDNYDSRNPYYDNRSLLEFNFSEAIADKLIIEKFDTFKN